MTLRPVGKLPSQIYWRRRLLVLIPLLGLIALTCYVACSAGGSTPTDRAAAASSRTSTSGASTSSGPSTGPSSSPSAGTSASAATSSTPTTTAPATGVAACTPANLTVAAAPSAETYPLGTEPVFFLQVTNTSGAACTQDLADPQVELLVYQGDTRLWGSHDCKIEPGTNVQTLSPGAPMRVSITWTGQSSQPGCGDRQPVPVGTYTLHATLSSTEGATATFSLT